VRTRSEQAARARAELANRLAGGLVELRERVARVRRSGDPSELHALRTAVRRVRVLLSETRELPGRGARARLEARLRRLTRASGALRDLDVLAAGRPRAPGLGALRAVLARRRERERARFLRVLARPELTHALAPAVAAPDDVRPGAALAGLAARRARRRRRWLCARGAPLDAQAPAEELHELRIQARKLRHLLEVLEGAFPARARSAWLERVSRLQRCLGQLHDAHVAARELGRAARALPRGAAARRAVAACIERCARREARARARFAQRLRAVADLDPDELAPSKQRARTSPRDGRVVPCERPR
jgi:CHAD domain-containing protein